MWGNRLFSRWKIRSQSCNKSLNSKTKSNFNSKKTRKRNSSKTNILQVQLNSKRRSASSISAWLRTQIWSWVLNCLKILTKDGWKTGLRVNSSMSLRKISTQVKSEMQHLTCILINKPWWEIHICFMKFSKFRKHVQGNTSPNKAVFSQIKTSSIKKSVKTQCLEQKSSI